MIIKKNFCWGYNKITLEKIIAISIGLGVCLTRLSTAVSQIALGLAALVGCYL